VFLLLLFFSNISKVYSDPIILGHIGKLENNTLITINGTGFTNKPIAKPLFWWRAENGTSPSSTNSRKLTWDNSLSGGVVFNGNISTNIVAPGSTQSIEWDHGLSEGAALGPVRFESDKLYIYRKLYEKFDVSDNYVIRTRVTSINGTLSVGDQVKGTSSSATGVISNITNINGRTTLYFDRSYGTINQNPPNDFIYGEPMISTTGSMVNDEGSITYPTGTFRTFNYKTLRLWNAVDKNNTYPVAQGIEGRKFNINREHTDNTLLNRDMVNPISQTPFKWSVEEYIYKSSDIDTSNGIFDFIKDGTDSNEMNTFISRTTAKPNRYDIVFQSQVSNGAQPDSTVYYDSLYIDDSWHRVILCNKSTYSLCTTKEIQIPVSWTDNQIVIQLNTGGLNLERNQPVYLYVIDGNGNPNTAGHPLGVWPAPVTRNRPVE
jgi:hypothetical protein